MKCLLCSKENTRQTGSYRSAGGTDYAVYKCQDCSLAFSDPMKPLSFDDYQGNLFEKYYADRWEFAKALDMIGTGKNMLEAGCGDGRFLALAKNKGLRVVGLDVNKAAVDDAKRRSGADRVYDWTIDRFAAAFPQERFDVICAFHLLEHLSDPVGFMRAASGMTAAGGIAVIAVPNHKRQSLAYADREGWDQPPHHLTWWDEKSLRRLMDICGFEIVAKADEPATVKSTVEAMIKKIRFGVINRLEKVSDRDQAAGSEENRTGKDMGRFLAALKRAVFYPAAVFCLIADRSRGLTGRNMLIVARKRG